MAVMELTSIDRCFCLELCYDQMNYNIKQQIYNMSSSKLVSGTWSSVESNFTLTYEGTQKSGATKYGNKIDKKGHYSATVWYDKNFNGKRDKSESVIAKYKAEASVVDGELGEVDTGLIEINKKKRQFKLFHEGDVFGVGKIIDMKYFFGSNPKNTNVNKSGSNIIDGTWNSNDNDFILSYQGLEKSGTVKYRNKTDKKGRLTATVWFDKNFDGKLNKNENVIAKYKAYANIVEGQLNQVDTGAIQINEKKGQFKLYYEGDLFGSGKIVDMDYFFG